MKKIWIVSWLLSSVIGDVVLAKSAVDFVSTGWTIAFTIGVLPFCEFIVGTNIPVT